MRLHMPSIKNVWSKQFFKMEIAHQTQNLPHYWPLLRKYQNQLFIHTLPGLVWVFGINKHILLFWLKFFIRLKMFLLINIEQRLDLTFFLKQVKHDKRNKTPFLNNGCQEFSKTDRWERGNKCFRDMLVPRLLFCREFPGDRASGGTWVQSSP